MADPVSRLTIAVLTYKRPRDLAAVLPLLRAQADAVAEPTLSTRVLVVDNDPEASARDTVAAAGADYANETTAGIAAARNRALAEAFDDDLLVFIDDDERPSERWLTDLLDTYRATGATAVVGPVISEFEVPPERWIVEGKFFVRRRMSTGTRIDVAATNNLLLDLAPIREWGLEFDLQTGISGGEDTLFTRTIHARGGLMVWCDEAIVVDVVPAARTTRRWVTLRAFSSGNSWSLTAVKLAGRGVGSQRTRLELSARGVARIAGGCVRILTGLFGRSIGQRARGVRTLARGAGMLLGAWGYVYMEYRR